MPANFYEVLGVPKEASTRTLRDAYRSQARALHPDRHAGSSDEELRRANDAMAELNVAWATLSNQQTRSAYDESLDRSANRQTPPWRNPFSNECRFCGSSPTAIIHLRQVRAAWKWTEEVVIDDPLCRNCGIAMFRSMTNKTLLLGWWSITSADNASKAIQINIASRRKLGKLRTPKSGQDTQAHLDQPMNIGKPLFFRSGPIALLSVSCLAIATTIFAFLAAPNSSPITSRPGASTTITSSPTTTSTKPLLCVTSSDTFTSCDQPHTYEVLTIVNTKTECPDSTTQYLSYKDDEISHVACLRK